MGTNYYLTLPEETCPTCGHDTSRDLHIGKSSMGWVFTWRGYRAEDGPAKQALTMPSEWFAYLEQETADRKRVIRDEYGDEVPFETLKNRVLGKRKTGLAVGHLGREVEGDFMIFETFG